MPAFLNPANAEFWVGVGLLIFLGIVIFVAKARRPSTPPWTPSPPRSRLTWTKRLASARKPSAC